MCLCCNAMPYHAMPHTGSIHALTTNFRSVDCIMSISLSFWAARFLFIHSFVFFFNSRELQPASQWVNKYYSIVRVRVRKKSSSSLSGYLLFFYDIKIVFSFPYATVLLMHAVSAVPNTSTFGQRVKRRRRGLNHAFILNKYTMNRSNGFLQKLPELGL